MVSLDTSAEFPRSPIKAGHQPFSWLAEELRIDAAMQFLAHTLDMAQGMQTCLGLIHASNQAREEGDPACPPTLNVADTECLTRLAMSAAGMLAEQAERRIEVLNQRQAERLGYGVHASA
ncbi:hypothetical protein [Collimonas sp.]|uniref:hypothetical protein n=1 Tax=Collimonas sp. TaxID=1963772 RepID=UPI002B550697|nr:hypothetical protein [Collimonas sp.]HWX01530.1 hypothetical protein [Collimonas sp.]